MECEQKVNDLEEELKKVYVTLIQLTKEKKAAEKEAAGLRSELDHMANMVKYVEDKEDQMENKYFFGNKNPAPYQTKKSSESAGPKMIAIKKIETSVSAVSDVKTNSDTTLRTIFHDNKYIHKVDN